MSKLNTVKKGVNSMNAHKVGNDLLTLKRKFHAYRPSIASVSQRMFWLSVAVTISFLLSQAYLFFFH